MSIKYFEPNHGVSLELLHRESNFKHPTRLMQIIDFQDMLKITPGKATCSDVDGVIVHYQGDQRRVLIVDGKYEGNGPLTTCAGDYLGVQRMIVDALNHDHNTKARLVIGGFKSISEEELFRQREDHPELVPPPQYSKGMVVRLVYGEGKTGTWKKLDVDIPLHEYWLNFVLGDE